MDRTGVGGRRPTGPTVGTGRGRILPAWVVYDDPTTRQLVDFEYTSEHRGNENRARGRGHHFRTHTTERTSDDTTSDMLPHHLRSSSTGTTHIEPTSMKKGGIVPKTGLYKLHKGEKVVPVKQMKNVGACPSGKKNPLGEKKRSKRK